jgi:hypothetical protein
MLLKGPMNPQGDLASLYERDFYAWTQQASELLRRGYFAQADIEHVAEEIADMGLEHKHALKSQTRRLILHLLKWQFQPQRRSSSWLESIFSARDEIIDVLEQSPSLKPLTPGLPNEVYARAVKMAARATKLKESPFPDSCPYTFEQIMDDDFLPGDPFPDPRE